MGPSTYLHRFKRIIISVFLFFNLVTITLWCLPLNSPLIVNFRNLVRPYMLSTALFQNWNMFAPSPPAANAYIEAAVIYTDGRTRRWKFPRMNQLGFVGRYYKERYRKFSENLLNPANSALWPDAARYIARINNDLSSPPTIVLLIKYSSDIVLNPNGSCRRGPLLPQIFFDYNVQPGDLK